MTSMEYDLNGRQSQWKTTSMQDNINGRQLQCVGKDMVGDKVIHF